MFKYIKIFLRFLAFMAFFRLLHLNFLLFFRFMCYMFTVNFCFLKFNYFRNNINNIILRTTIYLSFLKEQSRNSLYNSRWLAAKDCLRTSFVLQSAFVQVLLSSFLSARAGRLIKDTHFKGCCFRNSDVPSKSVLILD